METYKTHQETGTQQWVKQKRKGENIAPTTNYLNIWNDSPSFKDVNSTLVTIKTTFMVALLMFF